MQTIFVMVKCDLGKAYDVASEAVETMEQVSEVHSISGQYDLMMKVYLSDDQDIGHPGVETQRQDFSVFRRAVAFQRHLVAGDLEHHVARPGRALDGLESAAPDHEPGAVLGEGHGIRRDVLLVALRVGDIDPADPVSLCHDIDFSRQLGNALSGS